MDLELRVLGCGSNVFSSSSRVVMENKMARNLETDGRRRMKWRLHFVGFMGIKGSIKRG